jgi:hypothetical protein
MTTVAAQTARHRGCRGSGANKRMHETLNLIDKLLYFAIHKQKNWAWRTLPQRRQPPPTKPPTTTVTPHPIPHAVLETHLEDVITAASHTLGTTDTSDDDSDFLMSEPEGLSHVCTGELTGRQGLPHEVLTVTLQAEEKVPLPCAHRRRLKKKKRTKKKRTNGAALQRREQAAAHHRGVLQEIKRNPSPSPMCPART